MLQVAAPDKAVENWPAKHSPGPSRNNCAASISSGEYRWRLIKKWESADSKGVGCMEGGMNTIGVEPEKTTNSLVDRRRHRRYRFFASISVQTSESRTFLAFTLEISESGLSAALSGDLKVGDTVQLEPIAGTRVMAQVRHRVGNIYGFEFLQISAELLDAIREICSRLMVYPPNRMGI
jgi:hypothetical protein